MAQFVAYESETAKFPATVFALFVVLVLSCLHQFVLEPLLYGKLAHVPGPKLASMSWYYLSYFDLCLCRNEKISEWHSQYGPGIATSIRPC
jgi:hypothetical protein